MTDVDNNAIDGTGEIAVEIVPEPSISNVQFIPRQYIPKCKISLKHASECIFPGEDVTPEEKLASLNKLKDKAKHWFRNEIGKIFTTLLQNYDVYFKKVIQDEICRFRVRNIEEFILKIEQDSSDEFMKIIFNVCYKYFDININWLQVLEEKFMKEFGFQYVDGNDRPHKGRNKGCFEVLCALEKTELVKRIQRAGKKAHGKYLTIELPRKRDGKYQKRRAAIFYNEFIKCDTTKIGVKNSRLLSREKVSNLYHKQFQQLKLGV